MSFVIIIAALWDGRAGYKSVRIFETFAGLLRLIVSRYARYIFSVFVRISQLSLVIIENKSIKFEHLIASNYILYPKLVHKAFLSRYINNGGLRKP